MYGFVVTTAGEGLLARAAAGDTLTITAVRVGSGAVGSASAAKALTALIQDRAAGTYSTPQVSGGQLSLVAEYRNNLNGGLQTGFTLREFGVFARAGDDAPTLMYYAALGDRAPQVPPITEGLDVHRYPVAVAVSGELSVTVEDPAGAFVTDAELADYVPLSQKGQAGGVASLGSDGKVPEAQLPEMDYLPLSGGTMQGNLNMGAHRLTGLPAPQADSDAARKSDVDTMAALMSQGAKIATGNYRGTGTCGSGSPNSLMFPFEPKIVFIANSQSVSDIGIFPCEAMSTSFDSYKYKLIYGSEVDISSLSCARTHIYSDYTELEWYANDRTGDPMAPRLQLNSANKTYYYVAIG